MPVMRAEVLALLACRPGGTYVDGTVGGGGHAAAIARELVLLSKKGHQVRLIGLDIDPDAISAATVRLSEFGCRVVPMTAPARRDEDITMPALDCFKDMVILVKTSYVNVADVVQRFAPGPVGAVLMDLGMSSDQLEGNRGFAFERDGELDMRFDPDGTSLPAWKLLRHASLEDIKDWLRNYSQEPFAGRIARVIFERKGMINTTRDLVETVQRVVPRRRLRKTLARVFQALRIAVNQEIENLRAGLVAATGVLSPRGRLAVICYQSGEDRCVKDVARTFRDKLQVLTRKPITPSASEVQLNPRARSARLRVMEVRS